MGTNSQDVIVLGIEVDQNNGNNEFLGISGVTQGNWVEGVDYPLFNPENEDWGQITGDYDVVYYPMVYAICPDRTTTLTGSQTSAVLYEEVASCSASLNTATHYMPDDLIFFFNTVSSGLHILHSEQGTKLEIFDLTGKLFITGTLESDKGVVALEGSPTGIYFCRFTYPSGEMTVRKFYIN